MKDTFGPTSGTPFAQYDPIESCWKTCEDTSLWALRMSSLTLPTWGALRDGVLYELPTPERLTIEPGSSSLPTPVADNSRGLPNGGDYQSLPNAVLTLPTPTAQAAKHPTMDDRGEGTPDDYNLWSVTRRLLPTPAVNDMGAGKDPQAWEEWAARQKAADGTPAPHGKSLEQEALRFGALTQPPSTAGSPSSNDPHQPQLWSEQDEIA